ncbi:hypothetical protein DC74_722 [Streptomyces noursei]|nr:hypothetical protein DC74_722 [Streptomyces noursei]
MKFTGSTQGRKALVAEIIVGELARRLGLRVPELVLVDLDPAVAVNEPRQEVQDLLHASAGLNLMAWPSPGHQHPDPWLIDHGAALVFHHRWNTATNTTTKPYDLRHHALGPHQPEMATANAEFPPSPPNSCTKCSPPSPTPG